MHRGSEMLEFLQRGAAAFVALLLVCTLMSSSVAQAAQEDGTPENLPGDVSSDEPCFDGRMRIRDLEGADPFLLAELEDVMVAGKAWQADAALFSLRLGCPLLETGYELEGTFFSATAQSFYSTGTGETQATDDAPSSVTVFDVSNGLEVGFIVQSLIKVGISVDSVIDVANGVTIQPNTDSHPFGPENAPKGDVYYHVAVMERGEVRDIWIASSDGSVYRYHKEDFGQ